MKNKYTSLSEKDRRRLKYERRKSRELKKKHNNMTRKVSKIQARTNDASDNDTSE